MQYISAVSWSYEAMKRDNDSQSPLLSPLSAETRSWKMSAVFPFSDLNAGPRLLWPARSCTGGCADNLTNMLKARVAAQSLFLATQ